MVTGSAAKQKMWSLSSYKPGFLTLKHGERAMRLWTFTPERLPEQRVPRQHLPSGTQTPHLSSRCKQNTGRTGSNGGVLDVCLAQVRATLTLGRPLGLERMKESSPIKGDVVHVTHAAFHKTMTLTQLRAQFPSQDPAGPKSQGDTGTQPYSL